MEPANPAINHQVSSYAPQSSTYSYSAEQAPRASYMGPELGRAKCEHFPVHVHLQHPQPHPQPHPHTHPHLFRPSHSINMHEAIQMEIEKEWIRGAIIMSEIVRKRFEAEVRRELMMIDGNLNLHIGNNGFPVGSPPVMGFGSPHLGTTAQGRSLEERIELKGSLEDGEFETSPFRSVTADLRISEVKPVPVKEGAEEKERIIFPAKPNENISGSERSAITPPPRGDVNEFPLDGVLKKKAKVEWTCGLCQVHVNNECVLNQHLQGQKHKAKEAENISGSERRSVTPPPRGDIDESPSNGILKAKVEWSCGLCQVHVNNEGDLNQHLQGKKHKAKEAENIAGSERSTVTPPLRGDVSESPSDGVLKKKVKAEWSCGLCQFHVNNEQVLNEHLQGKKHKAKDAENISGSKRSDVTPSLRGEIENISESERSAVMAPPRGDVSESPSDGVLKKKAKVEWRSKRSDVIPSPRREIENISRSEKRAVTPPPRGDVSESPSYGVLKKKAKVEWRSKRSDVTPSPIRDIESISGSERRAVTPPPRGDVSKSPSNDVLKKKAKVEWSCGLCQFHVNNERVLNEHLQGKKHKAKETENISGSKRSDVTPLPRGEIENISGSEKSIVTTSLRGDVSESPSDGLLKKKAKVEWRSKRSDITLSPKGEIGNISGSERRAVTPLPRGDVSESPSDGILKKKAKVEWTCGLCQVHGNNERDLNQHLQGKKHKAKEVENIAGSERSIVAPPPGGDVSESPSDGVLKKKAKVEWSCGLCQVHGNTECDLNQHIRGKKHKAKEAENIAGSERSTVTLPPKGEIENISRLERSTVTAPPRGDVSESPLDGILKKKAKVEWRSKRSDVTPSPRGEIENISGSERNAVTPPPRGDVSESPSDGVLKKKAKVEWSCGLCQVHGNTECNLNQHIRGKKHKAKEAENIAGSERSTVTPPPRGEIENISRLERSTITAPPRGDVSESPLDGILKKKAKVEWRSKRSDVTPSPRGEIENISGSERNAVTPPPRGDVSESPSDGVLKKNAKVEWSCSLCQVHVNSECDLNQYLQGKKHKAKEAENTIGSERSTITSPPKGDVSESPSDGVLKKKAKAEWGCGLCQFHVNNERVLNEHLQGKKYKAKDAENIAGLERSTVTLPPRGDIENTSGSERSTVTAPPRGDVSESLSDGILKKKTKVEWRSKRSDVTPSPRGEIENISGSERRAVTPPLRENVSESPLDGVLKKKAIVEWSCGLCQVHVNNECVLNDHFQGKKHKAKEAALANTAGKNSRGLWLKITTKSTQVAGAVDPGKQASSKIDDLHDSLNSGNLKKNESVEVQKVQKAGDLNKKELKFWREVCNVGAASENVMNAHVNGKKHVRHLQKINRNGGAGSSDQKSVKPEDDELVSETKPDDDITKPNVGDENKDDKMTVS